jgi:hypothetical protein
MDPGQKVADRSEPTIGVLSMYLNILFWPHIVYTLIIAMILSLESWRSIAYKTDSSHGCKQLRCIYFG